ncbi:MAG: hypothetical protein RIE86_20660 [Imperialibacter sp.]|uniref:hypothetical protein n=1 Tax=Imperialibacter sp. TaxID=2038411 RepID=UPI0032EF8C5C
MRTILLFVTTAIILGACGSEDEELLSVKLKSESEYIKTGISCGLCAGVCLDSLAVTPNKLIYKRTTWGAGDPKTEIIEQAFTQKGWENLIGLVPLQEFGELELESCARCYDGCDYWLDIKSGGIENSISFPWNEFPQQVDSLTKALNSIKEQFNDN